MDRWNPGRLHIAAHPDHLQELQLQSHASQVNGDVKPAEAKLRISSELCALIYMLSGPAPANQVWLIGRAHVQILHHFLRSAARESLTRSGSRRPSN